MTVQRFLYELIREVAILTGLAIGDPRPRTFARWVLGVVATIGYWAHRKLQRIEGRSL